MYSTKNDHGIAKHNSNDSTVCEQLDATCTNPAHSVTHNTQQCMKNVGMFQ